MKNNIEICFSFYKLQLYSSFTYILSKSQIYGRIKIVFGVEKRL